MGGQLGGRKREDQPPAAGIDRGEIEHLAKEGSVCFSIAGENDRVNADDHRARNPKRPALEIVEIGYPASTHISLNGSVRCQVVAAPFGRHAMSPAVSSRTGPSSISTRASPSST